MDVLDHLMKKIVINAISLYDLEGNPVLSSEKSDLDIEDERLVGGFYTSITAFASMKNFASSIQLESESENGEIQINLIKKTDHFIGALLWCKNLKLSLHDCEAILDEFLSYMEQNLKSNEPRNMYTYISQYYRS